jgi:hypothetical protein
MARDNKVTEENLGAWVLKCNPAVWNLAGFLGDGNRVIDSWSVVENYRSAMMRHGQRVLLWVTGSEQGPLPRGLWGSGWVTSTVEAAVDDVSTASGDPDMPGVVTMDTADADGDEGYWLDSDARARVRFFVPIELSVWEKPVTEVAIRAVTGPDQPEVIRMRQASNPSWITVQQLQRLEPLLPPWPAVPPESETLVGVGPGGAGFGDPETRELVESAAMAAVVAYYEHRGFAVDDVSARKCGWDLTCAAPSGEIHRVEVKGLSGRQPVVLLSRNEYRSAREDDGWGVGCRHPRGNVPDGHNLRRSGGLGGCASICVSA